MKRLEKAEAKVLETELELLERMAEKEQELQQKVTTELALLTEKEGLQQQASLSSSRRTVWRS